jgi:hypothetical protein
VRPQNFTKPNPRKISPDFALGVIRLGLPFGYSAVPIYCVENQCDIGMEWMVQYQMQEVPNKISAFWLGTEQIRLVNA